MASRSLKIGELRRYLEQIVGFVLFVPLWWKLLRDRDQRRLAVGVAQGEIEFGFDITNAGW